MSRANDPVFPELDENPLCERRSELVLARGGMTLREHYAGQLAAAIVSSIHTDDCYRRLRELAREEGMRVSQWIARDAAKQADALLAELASPRESYTDPAVTLLRKVATDTGVPEALRNECARLANEMEIPF